ncbi:MAG: ABC transporter ATP-binding protein [Haemophilus parainfluenzae]|jgi:fepc protein|nr:ABC transporter ATP-binding protein [Haemophilus parainfluenzae]MDU0887840.1 ABC transporter ATP-binding protein [Haemophilus parainfluenzae]MDU1101877.1 ABC transporter ATP-binding protein [Haemophilus parainfluenzae]MDU6909559.1 ABC transporter ATP-binding protein [Haemophilus parainfluenzae]
MIRIEKLTQSYCLNNINCTLPSGKLIGIMGANGAGKSTLLKTIASILSLKQGEIWFDDQPLSKMNAPEKSQYIAYLAQNTQIHWDLSVYDVIALGLATSLPKEKERSKIQTFSEKFSVTHLLDKPFQQLSGGEKARVQLARCCIKESPVLLVDEPIAPLDPYYQIDMMEQLKSLTPQHTCIVAIHHLSLAYQFCDEIILLEKGKLLAVGETQAVLNAENLAKAFHIRAEIDPQEKTISKIEKQ